MDTLTTGPIVVTDTQGDPTRIAVEVGIDAGRGQTHLVGSHPHDEGQTIEVAFPSWATTYGFSAAELLRQRQAGPGEWGKFGAHEHVVHFEGDLMDTAVGELALARGDLGEPITNGWNDADRYAWLAPRLGLTGIAALYPQAHHITARVCVGVPVRLWTRERAASIAEAWAGSLKAVSDGREAGSRGRAGKKHEIVYKGRAVTIVVTECQVAAEGHAAWVAMPAERKIGTRLGVDIGAKTVLACWLDEGYVADTFQLEHGVEVVFDRLDQHLSASGLRSLSVRERYALRDALVAGQESYTIVHRGHRRDVLAVAKTLFAQAGTQIVRELAAQVESNEQAGSLEGFDGVDYSGGGVLFMGDAITSEHQRRGLADQVYLAPEPERWTARGYYQQLTRRVASVRKSGGKGGKGRRP